MRKFVLNIIESLENHPNDWMKMSKNCLENKTLYLNFNFNEINKTIYNVKIADYTLVTLTEEEDLNLGKAIKNRLDKEKNVQEARIKHQEDILTKFTETLI